MAFNKAGLRTGKYRSRLEARVALQLRGYPFLYEQELLPYECVYIPDWTLGPIIIEAKGYLDDRDRAKLIKVAAAHPERDLRMLFENARRRVKGTKLSYGDWSAKHGFKWAEATIPDEWFDDFDAVKRNNGKT